LIRNQLITFLIAGLGTMACTTHVSPPPRPKGVPADALWAGGADGGSFIRCSYDAGTDLNMCSAYNDRTGRLEIQGQFTITGPTRAKDVWRFEYSGFDGRRIYLTDGSVLAPREPAAK
jgi:hypothetical protein